MIRLSSTRLISAMKRTLVNKSTSQPKKLAVEAEAEALNLSKMSSDATCKPGPIRNPIVWIDMEMTGLQVLTDKIMEIAVLITDGELNIVAEGPNIVIHQDDDTLDNMNTWCVNQHGKTGLTQECRDSKISEDQAEDTVMLFLNKHLTKNKVPLAGHSVYVDRKFLAQYMPKIDEFLHYRIIDVTSVKLLCENWYPEEFANVPAKTGNHRAMDDIKCSVEELKYFRRAVFKPSTTTISDSD